MEFIKLISASWEESSQCFIARVEVIDEEGVRLVTEYAARRGDPHGIAGQVISSIDAAKAKGITIPTHEPAPEPMTEPDPTPSQLQAAIEAVAKAAGLSDKALDTVMESAGISRTIRTSPAIEGKT